MIDAINHTGMTVASVERSLEFYRDTLGMVVEEARSGEWDGEFLSKLTGHPGCRLRIVMVQAADGSRVQLEEFLHPRLEANAPAWARPGGGHLCIEVENIHELADKLRANGYEIVSNPPEPVPLPKESVNAGGFMMGVLDPDGHVIELLQTPTRRA